MIEIKELIKNYGEVRAVDRISCQIAQGECVGLLGLNGAGKTTLLRILACLLTPTSGTVTVDGHDVVRQPEQVRRLIGYLPEEPPLYLEMRVADFLAFVAGIRGVPRMDTGGRVQQALQRCQLEHMAGERIETLSYGYRKRVGIAQAIVHNPPLVILDEPIAGLDPAQIVEMRELIRALRGEHTLVLSSHILAEISQTCDRLLVLQRGRLVGSGTEEAIAGSSGREFRLEVLLRGQRALVEQALGQVEDIDERQLEQRGPDELLLRVVSSQDVRAQLAAQLVGAGLQLLELRRQRDQLEEVFLKLTGSKEGAS